MSPQRRAMRDEQKAERRQALIDAAWARFEQMPYDAINVIDVARDAGLAKGTLYLYFKTKEALFLAVALDRFAAWFDVVDAALPGARGVDAVVALISDTLAERPGLTRLFAILHIILERNIDSETALAFKQALRERLAHTAALLEAALPFLAQPDGAGSGGAQALLHTYALVIGIQHLAEQSPVVADVLAAHAELALFRVTFRAAFADALRALLRGLQADATGWPVGNS
ncbi:MAG: TetR family transcriptional regulator [Chloroflexota bacterium]